MSSLCFKREMYSILLKIFQIVKILFSRFDLFKGSAACETASEISQFKLRLLPKQG